LNPFGKLKVFRWTQSIDWPTWGEIQECLTFISQNNNKQADWNVDEDNIFDEYNHVVNVINDNLKEWQNYVWCLHNFKK